jgi:hypothetical protein
MNLFLLQVFFFGQTFQFQIGCSWSIWKPYHGGQKDLFHLVFFFLHISPLSGKEE